MSRGEFLHFWDNHDDTTLSVPGAILFQDVIPKDSKKSAEKPDLPVYNYPDAKDIPAKPAAQEAGKETKGKSFLGKIAGLFSGAK